MDPSIEGCEHGLVDTEVVGGDDAHVGEDLTADRDSEGFDVAHSEIGDG